MIGQFVKKLFGSHQERVLRDLWPIADRINEFYEQLDPLPDEAIQGKVWEFRARLHSPPIRRLPRISHHRRTLFR